MSYLDDATVWSGRYGSQPGPEQYYRELCRQQEQDAASQGWSLRPEIEASGKRRKKIH